MTLKPAVFLDRDGVINQDSPDFIKTTDELSIFDYAPAAGARLYSAGFLIVIITNQSGIGRGLITLENLQRMNEKVEEAFEDAGARVEAIYHCPHLPEDGCACRKPSPVMVLTAAREHNIDLTASYFVGDKPADIICGAAAGCKTILTLSGKSTGYRPDCFPEQPDYIARDLDAAVGWILESCP